MEQNTCFLDLTVGEATRTVCTLVEKAGKSSKMADCHELRQGTDLRGMVLVFEKYYVRAGGRMSMTVTLDDLDGKTRIHWTVTGGGGVFQNTGDSKVAAENYSNALREALFPYLNLDQDNRECKK